VSGFFAEVLFLRAMLLGRKLAGRVTVAAFFVLGLLLLLILYLFDEFVQIFHEVDRLLG
jgi:hypothetical protein